MECVAVVVPCRSLSFPSRGSTAVRRDCRGRGAVVANSRNDLWMPETGCGSFPSATEGAGVVQVRPVPRWCPESFPSVPIRLPFSVLEEAVPCCAPGGARYAGSGTSRCRGWCGTGGFRLLSTAARFSRVLSTDSDPRPHGPVIPAALRARRTDGRRAVVVGVKRGTVVSRRRGCGCAMGSISCFMRCRCGSCLRRRTGRWRCVDGGCRWCRCWTSRLAAGAWRVSPRREGREGAAGNGLGIDVGDARGRDEQRRRYRLVRPARGGELGPGRRAANRCGCR